MNTLAALSTSVAILITVSGCRTPPRHEATREARVDVEVEIVRAGERPAFFEAGGTVRARNIAILSSRIVAPILDVRARVGDRVRAGQPLILLDTRDLHAARGQAEAAVNAALHGARAAEADQQAAHAALTLASTSHQRMTTLRERNSATPAELDEAIAALRSAEARLNGAAARRLEADRAIEAARSALQAAAVTESYGSITAPFDGVLTFRAGDPGTLATPGAPLATVEDDRHFRLEVSLDASRAGGVAPGTRVEVSVDSAGGLELLGSIAEISGTVDPATHTVVLKIDLPWTPGLHSGVFGRVRLPGPLRRGVSVPASALIRRGQLSLVFTENDGTARMRLVHAGPSADGRVEILAGLAEGDRVILHPPPGLTDGAPVRTTTAAAPPPAEGSRS